MFALRGHYHYTGVQMIDTSIIRVHQHGACITRNRSQSMGSRGGLTSKIHAVVDTNGLPVRLALTAGQEHDNRANIPPGSNRNEPVCFSLYLYRVRNRSNGSSTRSNSVGGSRRATTNSRPTTSRSSSLRQFAYGFTLMSSTP